MKGQSSRKSSTVMGIGMPRDVFKILILWLHNKQRSLFVVSELFLVNVDKEGSTLTFFRAPVLQS